MFNIFLGFTLLSVLWLFAGATLLSSHYPTWMDEIESLYEGISSEGFTEENDELFKNFLFITCLYCGPIWWITLIYFWLTAKEE